MSRTIIHRHVTLGEWLEDVLGQYLHPVRLEVLSRNERSDLHSGMFYFDDILNSFERLCANEPPDYLEDQVRLLRNNLRKEICAVANEGRKSYVPVRRGPPPKNEYSEA